MPICGKEGPADLSVAIASVSGLPVLAECIEALERQRGVSVEVIVADRTGAPARDYLRAAHPGVRVIEAPAGTPIPELRAMAAREARSRTLAVLEDHCITGPGWAGKMLGALAEGHPVVAGPVKNFATRRLVDWAAFFCEYSAFMHPAPEGEAAMVPGNNVVYDRGAIEGFDEMMDEGLWDAALHERLKGRGVGLYMTPAVTVGHKMTGGLAWFLTQKFHFARAFAGARLAGASRALAPAYSLAALLLPLVIGRRITASIWRRGAYRREFVLSSPFLLLLLLAWAAGESVGYMAGPGRSTAKVA